MSGEDENAGKGHGDDEHQTLAPEPEGAEHDRGQKREHLGPQQDHAEFLSERVALGRGRDAHGQLPYPRGTGRLTVREDHMGNESTSR